MSLSERYAGSNTKAGGLGTALGFTVANAIAIPLGLGPDEPLYLLIVGAVSVLGAMVLSYFTKNDESKAREEAEKTRDALLEAWLTSGGNAVVESPTSSVTPENPVEVGEPSGPADYEAKHAIDEGNPNQGQLDLESPEVLEDSETSIPKDENGYPDFSKL